MKERVFLMLKPDAIEGKLIGKIIGRVEKENLIILGLRLVKPETRKIEAWYRQKDDLSKKIYPPMRVIVRYLVRGPILLTVWEGEKALKKIRKIVGDGTEPKKCEAGSIRRDYGIDTLEKATEEKRAIENLVHASRSLQTAKREIAFWFE
ncbi:MAG TPA: nucleoside-diphosphate kinase [Candidatus Nanoarchaeia archaeon]|nr:nucleoside-diphosphate kinase [Candidatus Nanoarchaeia archaeon]